MFGGTFTTGGREPSGMTTVEMASLVVLAVIGVALTYFGYEAAWALLHYGGLAAGAAAGGWLGVVVVPGLTAGELSPELTLVVAAACCLVGAGLGWAFVPALGRLAVGILGFTLTGTAALVLASEGQVMDVLTQTLPQAIESVDPGLLVDRLADVEFVAELSPAVALGAVVLVGLLGGTLALAHKWLILGAGMTAIGALVLAVVVPLLVGSPTLTRGEVVDSFSMLWFVGFLVTGLFVEVVRYADLDALV